MKIVLYEDRNKKDNRIKEGLHALKYYFEHLDNIEFIYVLYESFKLIECDCAIIWNIHSKAKHNTLYRKKVKDLQIKNNNKLLIIELGYIQRSIYYSLSFNHIINFGNYPDFPDSNDRIKKLDLKIHNIKYDNSIDKYILFCLQVPYDTQVQNVNYNNWVIHTLKIIIKYKHKNRKIVIRHHPNYKNTILLDSKFFNKHNINISSNKSLKKDIKNCYCVVAYNSTALIDSIFMRKPIVSNQSSSIVEELAVKDFKLIEQLPKLNINQIQKCMKNISYKQWTYEEIKSGHPFEYFLLNIV